MKREMSELKHPYVGSEHLLLAILNNKELMITKELLKIDLTYEKFREELINIVGIGKKCNDMFLYTPLLKRVFNNVIMNNKGEDRLIEVEDLFISLLDEGEGVANRILLGMNIDIDYLYEKFIKKFNFNKKTIKKNMLLEEFSIDMNSRYKSYDPVIGRDREVDRLIEILLRRTKNNPVLIGDAGVGKTAIVEEFVRRIEEGKVPKKLCCCRVFSLSLSSLIAGTKYRGEFEERINQVIDELVSDENVIIFIDEIHTLVGAGGAEGAIDASNILKPYLARGDIQVIGATTKEEYKKFIESDKALDRRFQKINVDEMSIEQTRDVLFNIRELYSKYHGVSISDEIINNIIGLCDKYVHYGKFPDKAIDIFDEVCAKSSIIEDDNDKKIRMFKEELNQIRLKKNELIIENNFKEASIYRKKELNLERKYNQLNFDEHEKNVLLDSLYDVVYGKTGIPVKKLLSFNKQDVYDKLSGSVIGQDLVIYKMCDIMDNVNKSNNNVPISLLFVGKSGVGKTFLEKEYSKLFYNDNSIIKLDLSEYGDDSSISKILGVSAGYVGYKDFVSLCDKVRRNSYSVLIFENLEYGSKKILKLLSSILEDGYLIDSSNEKVDFRNCIMFFETNYGCEQTNIGFSTSNIDSLLIKDVLGEEMFSKFSGILRFKDLDRDDVIKIINSKGILSPKLVDKIVEECNYKRVGARKIDYLVSIYKESVEV